MRSKTSLPLVLLTALFLSGPNSVHATPKTLDIYFIDVEGGVATLIVTPTGQSLLIDTGFPGDRDAGRIAHAALEIARLKQIDYCVITHWHRDHVGGVPALAKLIPIKNYYDHGLPQTIAPDMQAELIEACAHQLHRNVRTTDTDNTMSGYIANEEEVCQGNLIKVSVDPRPGLIR
jgi:glyoxylase-like metal-dependent hydrolase (beta-lactamase superfamily II)